MLHLNFIDVIVFFLFAIAIYKVSTVSKNNKNSVLQFLVAGRKLPISLFVASFVSCWYGETLVLGEGIYRHGLAAFFLLLVPYYVFTVIYALFFAKKVRGSEEISIPERLRACYGPKVGLLGTGLVFLLSLPAANILMMGSIIQMITGWSLIFSVIISGVASALFTTKGGMFADAKISVLACVLILIGFLSILYNCLMYQPPQIMLNGLSKNLLSLDGGLGGWGYLSFFLLGIWTIVDPGYHQKVSSVSSPKSGYKGLLYAISICACLDLVIVLIGLYGMSMIKHPLENPLHLIPTIANTMLPNGMKALFLCGLLATLMSDTVSDMLINGSTLGRDLFLTLRTQLVESQILRNSKLGIFITTSLAISLCICMPSVLELWLDWSGCFVGLLFVPTVLSYYNYKKIYINSSNILISTLVAFVISAVLFVYGKMNGITHTELQLWNGGPVFIGSAFPALIISGLMIFILSSFQKHRSRRILVSQIESVVGLESENSYQNREKLGQSKSSL